MTKEEFRKKKFRKWTIDEDYEHIVERQPELINYVIKNYSVFFRQCCKNKTELKQKILLQAVPLFYSVSSNKKMLKYLI